MPLPARLGFALQAGMAAGAPSSIKLELVRLKPELK
jgi:hypothetical protein